jgi:NADH-quinone oxidoreductase subunit L
MIKVLGPVHNTLRNKYFIDEAYETVFIKPSQAIARATGDFIDRGIIDGILHAIGVSFRWIGDLVKMFNLWLIDGFGDGIPLAIGWAGRQARRVQTGRVQQYLLLVAAAAVIIGLIVVVSAGTATN